MLIIKFQRRPGSNTAYFLKIFPLAALRRFEKPKCHRQSFRPLGWRMMLALTISRRRFCCMVEMKTRLTPADYTLSADAGILPCCALDGRLAISVLQRRLGF